METEFIVKKLIEVADKYPEYASKIQWAIESLTSPFTTPGQKMVALNWSLSIIKTEVKR